jgi:hypothetical protein
MGIEASSPPPWDLTGSGYILLYRLPPEMAQQYVPFGEHLGGLSVAMFVEYTGSNVGPYHEVLFIPGRVRYPSGEGYSITRIYVSTMESVVNGIANWAIPKSLASFEKSSVDMYTERIKVNAGGEAPLIDAAFNAGGIRFPAYGGLLPPLVQFRDGQTYTTRIKATGQAQFASSIKLETRGDAFPPLEFFTPLAALKISGFSMTFPVPDIHRED